MFICLVTGSCRFPLKNNQITKRIRTLQPNKIEGIFEIYSPRKYREELCFPTQIPKLKIMSHPNLIFPPIKSDFTFLGYGSYVLLLIK